MSLQAETLFSKMAGKVERKIAVMTRRIRSTLNSAKLSKAYRQKLWGECIMYLEDVENVLQSRKYEQPAYKAFFQKELEGLKALRQFGEVAYVKFGGKIKGKLKNRGVPMMYLGRPRNHSGDTYRLLNLATDRVIHSRDAMWLGKVYGEWKGLAQPTMPDMVTLLPLIDMVTGEKKDAGNAEPQGAAAPQAEVNPARAEQARVRFRAEDVPELEGRAISQKGIRELARLGSDLLNPEAQSLTERLREVQPEEMGAYAASPFVMVDRFGGDIGSYAEYGFSAQQVDPSKYKDIYENPKSFDEAWNHEDPFQRDQ